MQPLSYYNESDSQAAAWLRDLIRAFCEATATEDKS